MDSLINFWHEQQQRIATLVCMLLVVLMMMAVVDTTVFVLDNLDPMPVPQATDLTKPSSRPKNNVDITKLNIFGRAEVISAPTTADTPQTKLNLELYGVFTSDDPSNSTAVVAQKNKAGELFSIGDRLPGNATLDSVHDDHILIKRGGRLEKLMFSEQSLLSPTKSTNNTVNRPPRRSSSDSRLSQIRSRITVRETAKNSPQPRTPGATLRQYVETHKETIAADPTGTLSNLGVSAVEQGEAKGYQLSLVSNDMLDKAGLKRGDVILSVNGTPVGNVVNDSALIDRTLAQKRVRVEVKRDTRRFFLTVPIP
mgnify:FL=1